MQTFIGRIYSGGVAIMNITLTVVFILGFFCLLNGESHAHCGISDAKFIALSPRFKEKLKDYHILCEQFPRLKNLNRYKQNYLSGKIDVETYISYLHDGVNRHIPSVKIVRSPIQPTSDSEIAKEFLMNDFSSWKLSYKLDTMYIDLESQKRYDEDFLWHIGLTLLAGGVLYWMYSEFTR